MIKRLVLALALILPIAAFAQSKFGTVDVQSVISAMPEYEASQKQLEDASKKYQAEFDKLNEELTKLYAEFQNIANDGSTPESIKERRLNEIQEREAKVNQFRQTASQDLSRLQEQLLAPIQQKFNEAVKAVGQDGAYTFIFPNEPSMLLYTGSAVVDVTADVKKKLGL